MVIAIDIGNTNITFGGFKGEELIFVSRIATDDKKTEDQYAVDLRSILKLNNVNAVDVCGVCISSVVPNLSEVIKKAVLFISDCKVITVSSGVKTGLNIKTDNPRQMGSDIVCGAVWAKKKDKVPVVLVDLGTATTFTVIDKNGILVGYSIMPGMEVSLNALRENAAQLPSVGIDNPHMGIIGKNTVDAMVSGIVFGTASAVDGMIDRFKMEMEDEANVIITGGYGKKISPFLKNCHVLDDNIILKGLYIIWQKNQPK